MDKTESDGVAKPPDVGRRAAGIVGELDAAVVRVQAGAGGVAGSGFLIDRRHVVTCAHVVAAALGLASSDEPTPDSVVSLDFPLSNRESTVRARVEVWQPIERDESGDIAVLSLLDDPPAGTGPARLVGSRDLWGHPFRCFGFPRGRDEGVWVAGVLRASQSVGWVQMQAASTGYAVEDGFSGGAVWDDELTGVVGMTVAADGQPRAAFLITADRLISAWPQLNARTLQPTPYRGLHAFRAQDSQVFFGREELVARLVRDVVRQPIVSLIGPSGSGKSSLLFAGVLPGVQQRGWVTVNVRPAQAPTPILSLAGALLEHLEPDLSETDRLTRVHLLAVHLAEGRLPELLDRLLVLSQAPHLLLSVDQFEESFERGSEAAEEFIATLLCALQDQGSGLTPKFTVVLTLRADFLTEALRHPALAAALQDSVVTVGQMGRTQLRSVIEGPLPADVGYEPGLVDRILDDVGEGSGSLPLLEFALTLLWEHQERGLLTHAAYEELGGVDGALASYAEQVYGQLREEDRAQARPLFIQLVRPSDVGVPVRRVARAAELGDARWQLAQRLAATRLLVADQDSTGTQAVELVHEALIGGWNRLSAWIHQDLAFRSWQEQVRAALGAWTKAGRDAGALLRGAPLAEAEDWLEKRGEELGEAEVEFITSSVRARERSTRRLRVATLTLAMLLLGAAILSGVVVQQYRHAAQETLVAGSRDLARQADALSRTDPRTGMLLAASAYRMSQTADAIRVLTRYGNDHVQVDRVLRTGLAGLQNAEFSPADPDVVALYGPDFVALWDVATNARLAMRTFDLEELSGAFSPDGETIALSGSDRSGRTSLVLWHWMDDSLYTLSSRRLSAEDGIDGLRFNANAQLLAFCAGERIEVWSGKTHALIAKTGRVVQNTCSFGFTSGRDLTYVDGKQVVVWDTKTEKTVRRSGVPVESYDSDPEDEESYDINVATDGETALLTDSGGRIMWWNVQRGRPFGRVWETIADDVEAVRFSSNGTTALLTTWRGAVTLDVPHRTVAGGFALPPSSHSDMTLNSTGRTLGALLNGTDFALIAVDERPGIPVFPASMAIVRGQADKVAIATTLDTGFRVQLYRKLNGELRADPASSRRIPGLTDELLLSPTGHHVAATQYRGDDQFVTITPTQAKRGYKPRVLTSVRGTSASLAFDPTGELLAVVQGSELAVYSVSSGRRVHRLKLPAEYAPDTAVLSPGGRYAGAAGGGRVTVWDLSSMQSTDYSAAGPTGLAFSSTGRWLSVYTVTETELWELGSNQKVLSSPAPSGRSDAKLSSFDVDDRYLAVASASETMDSFGGPTSSVEIWSVSDLRLLGVVPFQSSFSFMDDGKMLVAGRGGVQTMSFLPEDALVNVCRITGRDSIPEDDWRRYAPGFEYVAPCP